MAFFCIIRVVMKVAEPWGGEENETFLMSSNGREAVCPSMTSE